MIITYFARRAQVTVKADLCFRSDFFAVPPNEPNLIVTIELLRQESSVDIGRQLSSAREISNFALDEYFW